MVTLEKATDGTRVISPGAAANDGSSPLLMIGGQPVRKIMNVSVIRMSGNIRRVTVRPGLFAGSVSMIRYRNGAMGLLDSESEPPAVVAAWVRMATTSGVFAGLRGMR